MHMDDEARSLVRRLAAAILPAAREQLGAEGGEALDRVADALTAPDEPSPDPVALLFAAGAALRTAPAVQG